MSGGTKVNLRDHLSLIDFITLAPLGLGIHAIAGGLMHAHFNPLIALEWLAMILMFVIITWDAFFGFGVYNMDRIGRLRQHVYTHAVLYSIFTILLALLVNDDIHESKGWHLALFGCLMAMSLNEALFCKGIFSSYDALKAEFDVGDQQGRLYGKVSYMHYIWVEGLAFIVYGVLALCYYFNVFDRWFQFGSYVPLVLTTILALEIWLYTRVVD